MHDKKLKIRSTGFDLIFECQFLFHTPGIFYFGETTTNMVVSQQAETVERLASPAAAQIVVFINQRFPKVWFRVEGLVTQPSPH
jgi:hypothetical protein